MPENSAAPRLSYLTYQTYNRISETSASIRFAKITNINNISNKEITLNIILRRRSIGARDQ